MTDIPRKYKWELTREALDALLAKLDQDRPTAGEKYELLRNRLVKFFEWRSIADPQERADVTLNRVARNLDAGDAVRDLNSYAYGVARLVALETVREVARSKAAVRELRTANAKDLAMERRSECLSRCLAKLTVEERQLIEAYYQGSGMEKIEGRKRLANGLGLLPNVVRIRACRIRAALEDCLRACISEL